MLITISYRISWNCSWLDCYSHEMKGDKVSHKNILELLLLPLKQIFVCGFVFPYELSEVTKYYKAIPHDMAVYTFCPATTVISHFS